MGMYTGFKGTFFLRKETPKEVLDMLKWLCNPFRERGDVPEELPDHDFFECRWWMDVLSGIDNVYVGDQFPCNMSKLRGASKWDTELSPKILYACGSLKNYSSEIELFLEWIKPWVTDVKDATYRYEEFGTQKIVLREGNFVWLDAVSDWDEEDVDES